jgi:hypothetical protein
VASLDMAAMAAASFGESESSDGGVIVVIVILVVLLGGRAVAPVGDASTSSSLSLPVRGVPEGRKHLNLYKLRL